MILGNEKSFYLSVERVSVLLQGLKSEHRNDYYYIKCPHSFELKKQAFAKIMTIFT